MQTVQQCATKQRIALWFTRLPPRGYTGATRQAFGLLSLLEDYYMQKSISEAAQLQAAPEARASFAHGVRLTTKFCGALCRKIKRWPVGSHLQSETLQMTCKKNPGRELSGFKMIAKKQLPAKNMRKHQRRYNCSI
jgi:hypothetical protein